MEEILDDLNEENPISEKEIFIKIWTEPRRVFKFINEHYYEKYSITLLVLAGISRSFDRASIKNMGDDMSLGALIAICVIFGGLFGWIGYYFYAALLSWTGGWLKGAGDTSSLLRMLSYALLPSVIAIVFLIPQIAIYGNEMFKSEGDTTSADITSNIIFYTTGFFELVLGIWTIVLFVVGTSEVQKISIGKAILNLVLPVIVIVIPILIIILLVSP